MCDVNFIKSIKIVPDKEKEMFLKIQDKIEKKDISLENIIELTKNLTESEKQRLKQLYLEQIDDLNSSTENYKKKILKIKSNLNKRKGAVKSPFSLIHRLQCLKHINHFQSIIYIVFQNKSYKSNYNCWNNI